jgi:hypothetical protein
MAAVPAVTIDIEPTPEQDTRLGDPESPPTPWADTLGVLEAAPAKVLAFAKGRFGQTRYRLPKGS